VFKVFRCKCYAVPCLSLYREISGAENQFRRLFLARVPLRFRVYVII